MTAFHSTKFVTLKALSRRTILNPGETSPVHDDSNITMHNALRTHNFFSLRDLRRSPLTFQHVFFFHSFVLVRSLSPKSFRVFLLCLEVSQGSKLRPKRMGEARPIEFHAREDSPVGAEIVLGEFEPLRHFVSERPDLQKDMSFEYVCICFP